MIVFAGFLYLVGGKYLAGKNDNIAEISSEVNVYSSRKEALVSELFDEFTAETGIKVNFIIDKAPKLLERLKSEGKNSPADLFLTSDVGNLQKASDLGLLRPIKSKILNENIPENLRDDEGRWFGLSRRVRAIFYAKDRVNPEQLSTYEDLADEKWRGKILIRSSSNIYNQSLLASLIEVNGEDAARKWVKGLVANMARKPQGGDTDQLRALAAGQGDIAVANSYYYGRLQASSKEKDQQVADKIAIFFPNQMGRGAHVNISGGGLTTSSKNLTNAIKLLEFLSNPSSQEFYAQVNHEFPISKEITVSNTIKNWGSFQADSSNLLKFSRYLNKSIKISDEEGWR